MCMHMFDYFLDMCSLLSHVFASHKQTRLFSPTKCIQACFCAAFTGSLPKLDMFWAPLIFPIISCVVHMKIATEVTNLHISK